MNKRLRHRLGPCLASGTLGGLLALFLVQCGGPAPDAGQVLSVTYWRTLSGAAGEAQDRLVDEFNASQGAVRVTAEFQGGYADLGKKLITAAAAKTGPDVTQLGTYEIRQFVRSGLLVDLRPYLEGPEGLDTSDWAGTMRSAGELEGGIYWLPFNVAVPVLYCNREALQTAGLAGPPQTWDEFFRAARALTLKEPDGRVKRVGVALWNDVWPYLSAIWSEGGELTSKDYASITLNDPIAVQVLTRFQQLVQEGAASVPDTASGGHRALFKNGRAAMILDSPASFADIVAQSTGFTPEVANYPSGAAGRVYAPGGGGLAMLATTPEAKRPAAWAFIKFLLSPERLAEFSQASGYAAFSESARRAGGDRLNDPRFATLDEALPHLRGDFSVNMSPAVREPFSEALQKILIDRVDVQQALDEADAKAEQRIKDER